MVFHVLPMIAYYGAKEAFKYVDKKLDEREERKAREQREREQEERDRIWAAGADKRARDAAEAHNKKLRAELKEAQRREKERIEEEERLEAIRLEKAEIAEANRKAELARLQLEADALAAKLAADIAQAKRDADAVQDKLEKERKERERIKGMLDQALQKQKAAEDALLRGIPPDVRPTRDQLHQFRKKYGYQVNKLHVAVVGESGMGKSTFINAVRGLAPGDAGYATASMNECTMEVTRYDDPRHVDLVWYDVPGANTPTITGWSYFMDQGLFAFDALILVFSDRFTQTVGTLMKNAKTCNKPVYLVRTKADQLMWNLRYDIGGSASDEELKDRAVEMTRETVRKNMELISMPSDIEFYLVSRDALTAYSKAGQMMSSNIHEQKLLDDIYANKKSDAVPS